MSRKKYEKLDDEHKERVGYLFHESKKTGINILDVFLR